MADQFGLFWNSINSDRTYDADSFAEWLRKFFTTGIFNGEMQVTPGTGMQVNVAPGYANLNGKVRFFDAAQTFTLDPASGTYPRIDTIVVRSDSTNRIITTEYVKGAYSGNSPVPIAPVRTGGIYEIVLAQILVGAGITAIMAQDITDTRPNDSLCGWVTSTVESVPMDQITTQMQADFLAWYDRMKGQLSEDAAGNLQLQVDAVRETAMGAYTAITNNETSPATSAHSVGDIIYYQPNGAAWPHLYVVYRAINVGDELVDGATSPNGNIARTNMEVELGKLGNRIDDTNDDVGDVVSRVSNAESGIVALRTFSDQMYYGFAETDRSPTDIAHKSGDVFFFDNGSVNELVLATRDISAGATLQIGTNIRPYTLGQAINALNNGLSNIYGFVEVLPWGTYGTVGQTATLNRDITKAKMALFEVGWNSLPNKSGLNCSLIPQMMLAVGSTITIPYVVGGVFSYVIVNITSATSITIIDSNNTNLGLRAIAGVF